MPSKNPNGAGSIGKYRGRWVGRLSLPDGRRKAVYGRTFEETRAKLTAVQRELDLGQLPPGDRLSVGVYLTHWLEDHVRPRLRPSTYQVYSGHVHNHILPAFGRVRLMQLSPAHIEALMTSMQAAGLTAATACRVRATLRVALARAVRHGLVTRNVAALAEPPREVRKPVEPLTVAEASRLLVNDWPTNIVVHGFGYEDSSHASHVFLHRGEYALFHWFPQTGPTGPGIWDHFRRLFIIVDPLPGSVGDVHHAHNVSRFGGDVPGVGGDDVWNPSPMPSDHQIWYQYPDLNAPVEQVGCARWGCTTEGYYLWFGSHIPAFRGESNEHPNNWWPFISRPGCYLPPPP